MAPKLDPWRDRPSAAQSASTSAAFVFTTEAPQHAQQMLPRNATSLETEPNLASAEPHQSTRLSATGANKQDGQVVPSSMGAVADQIDQLEDEVIHFMNLSLEEKEKAEVLSGQLASVTQEKEDLERQVDDLDHELGQIEWQGQDDAVSATDTGNTISKVNAKVIKLRTTAQKLKGELDTLDGISADYSAAIALLEEKIGLATKQLSQEVQEEKRLRKELQQMEVALESEKMTNGETRDRLKSIEQDCGDLRTSNAWTDKKLAESEQTMERLRTLVKQKGSEMEGARTFWAIQAEIARQELERKQKEIDKLNQTKNSLELRCKKAEIALQDKPGFKRTHESSEAVRLQEEMEREAKRMKINSMAHHEALKAAHSRGIKEKDDVIKKLVEDRQRFFEDLQRKQNHRVRGVAIAIDLSGSAAGSLTEGIEKIYSHLLASLRRSRCLTYVMTVLHGPGDTVAVKSVFGDTWDTHENVLLGQNAGGVEQHVASLRKIKEVAASTGLVLDLQVVLIGDGNTQPPSQIGCNEVCHDFVSSKPVVQIHSVVVKTDGDERQERYSDNLNIQAGNRQTTRMPPEATSSCGRRRVHFRT